MERHQRGAARSELTVDCDPQQRAAIQQDRQTVCTVTDSDVTLLGFTFFLVFNCVFLSALLYVLLPSGVINHVCINVVKIRCRLVI